MPVRATRQSVNHALIRLNAVAAREIDGEGYFTCYRSTGRYVLERKVTKETMLGMRLQWVRVASAATASAMVAILDGYLDGYRAGCEDTDAGRRKRPPVEPDADAADCCPVTGQEYGTGA